MMVERNIKKNLLNDFETERVKDGYNERFISINQYFIGIYKNNKKNGYGIMVTFIN